MKSLQPGDAVRTKVTCKITNLTTYHLFPFTGTLLFFCDNAIHAVVLIDADNQQKSWIGLVELKNIEYHQQNDKKFEFLVNQIRNLQSRLATLEATPMKNVLVVIA